MTAASVAPVLVTGWGRTAATAARRHPVASAEDVVQVVRQADRVLPRGLGRSYGDAAQCAGGDLVSTLGLASVELDPATGVVVAGGGASLDAVLRAALPHGWFLPVSPGTRYVTVGGAVAADVHGKNHHVDGSFGRHVRWLELVDGSGTVRRLAPDAPDPLDVAAFRATVGGLGLTGVVTRAAFALHRVPSTWMDVDTERCDDLAAVTAALRAQDAEHRYTVAWLDAAAGARGRGSGRGIVTGADHTPADDVRGVDPLAYAPRTRLVAPPTPVGLVRPGVVRGFDALWWRRAPAQRTVVPQRLHAFFHPLDAVAGWNRLYGPRGFLQYQFVVPDHREDVLETALGRLRAAAAVPALAVLKRFGPEGDGFLSFPRPGWTLALDVPVTDPDRLTAVLDGLDAEVATAGGAVYLVKDARCRPDLVQQMYPRLRQWRVARSRLDPRGCFRSDLAVRLGLVP